jgi:hypothetical protein
MNRKIAFDILNIKLKYNELNENLLRKYYHISCLKTHPDKNGCNSDFLKVKEAYDYLKDDLFNHCKSFNNKEWKNMNKYSDENREDENNDKELNHLYETVMEYIKLFKPFYYLFTKNIELNPSLKNLFKKDLYYFKEYNIYIPLWHKEIILFDRINIIIKPSLPENVSIDDENNIYIKLDKFTENYNIDNLSFYIPLNENKKYFKGIPKINEKNIYDITNFSDLIFIR